MPRQDVEPLPLGAVAARPFRQFKPALDIDPRALHKPVGHLNCLGVERQHGHPLAQSPSPTRTDRRRSRFPLAETLRSQSRPRVPKKAASMLIAAHSLLAVLSDSLFSVLRPECRCTYKIHGATPQVWREFAFQTWCGPWGVVTVGSACAAAVDHGALSRSHHGALSRC